MLLLSPGCTAAAADAVVVLVLVVMCAAAALPTSSFSFHYSSRLVHAALTASDEALILDIARHSSRSWAPTHSHSTHYHPHPSPMMIKIPSDDDEGLQTAGLADSLMMLVRRV